MPKLNDILFLFEELVDQKANTLDDLSASIEIFEDKGLGYSQLNEILLLLGFKRASYEFFQFLANGEFNYKPETSIETLDQFKVGIDRFMKIALLFYGNIKFAYKELSSNSEKLYNIILESLPTDIDKFLKRHTPIRKTIPIPSDKTYLLGHIIEGEIDKRKRENPDDIEAIELNNERLEIVEIAEKNQTTYLASDHLDVYVATSMRANHDFLFVNKVIKEIFEDDRLIELNLRYFDPTQAYCRNRIDKGLSEALMLKTALCTLYLAQEAETLGKDSELASTLAQGKAVIAYVPEGTKEFVDDLIKRLLVEKYSEKDEKEIIVEQLRVFSPELAWKDRYFRQWLDDINNAPILEMKNRLYTLAENYYNKRALILQEEHPLGVQVNLKSGVANGVLVARKIEDCVKLIRNVVLNDMEFEIQKNIKDQEGYIYLKEQISDCIFRGRKMNSV